KRKRKDLQNICSLCNTNCNHEQFADHTKKHIVEFYPELGPYSCNACNQYTALQEAHVLEHLTKDHKSYHQEGNLKRVIFNRDNDKKLDELQQAILHNTVTWQDIMLKTLGSIK